MINLHALLATDVQQQEFFKFDELADSTNEFIVAYPEGLAPGYAPEAWVASNPLVRAFFDTLRTVVASEGRSWNAGLCCGSASEAVPPPTDEIAFFRKLIIYIQDVLAQEQNFVLDMDRIYVTGMSNGGFMTHRVACEMSDIIAAVAPVAGPMFDNSYKRTALGFKGDESFRCKPKNPIPLLQIHSKKDLVVPFQGNPLLGFPNVPQTIEFWREQNGVNGSNAVRSVTAVAGPRMLSPIFPFSRTYTTTTCTRYEAPENDPNKDNTAAVELCEHGSDVFVGHC